MGGCFSTEMVKGELELSTAQAEFCEDISLRVFGACYWFLVLAQRSLLNDAALSLRDGGLLPR